MYDNKYCKSCYKINDCSIVKNLFRHCPLWDIYFHKEDKMTFQEDKKLTIDELNDIIKYMNIENCPTCDYSRDVFRKLYDRNNKRQSKIN